MTLYHRSAMITGTDTRHLLGLLTFLAGVLVVAALLIFTASADADTIHLELSPAEPPRSGQLSGTVSGEASSTNEYVHVGNPNQETACPAEWSTYTKGWIVPNEFGGLPPNNGLTATTPRYSDAFTYLFGGGPVLCAYLTSGQSGRTVASAKLDVVYGPSKEEVEQKQKAQEQAEREAAEQERAKAAEKEQAEREAAEQERRDKEIEERKAVAKNAEEGQSAAEAAEVRREAEARAQLKYEEEAPAREAAAKKAKEAAALAAIEAEDARLQAEYEGAATRAHQTPVKYLSVRVMSRRENSSQHPGESLLQVTVASFARVTVSLSRNGRHNYGIETNPYAEDAFDLARGEDCGSVSEWNASCDSSKAESISPTVTNGVEIPWSCNSPGGTYRYVVTARSDVGRSLVRRGTFKPVSIARCHELKRHEQEAKERSARKYAEEVGQRAREERERLEQRARREREMRERYEKNCRALGGTPVTLHTSEGAAPACRAPAGGILWIPPEYS